MKRFVSAGLLVVASLVGVGLVASSPAQAASCSAKDVTVVVQFPDHTSVGCASGDPSSGYAALEKAGFPLTYATGNGAGAICSIAGYPGHRCPSMPASNAYWAYFHAKPGGAWSYSDTGGGSYNPKPGSVEGWRFGDGSAPTTRAPSLPVSTPTKAPTTAPTKAATKKPVTKPTTGTGSATATPTAPDATATSTSTASSTPTAGPSATATDDTVIPAPTTTGAPTTTAEAGQPTKLTQPDDDSGSGGLSWIWGIVLLAVVAGGGAVVVVRRRA